MNRKSKKSACTHKKYGMLLFIPIPTIIIHHNYYLFHNFIDSSKTLDLN